MDNENLSKMKISFTDIINLKNEIVFDFNDTFVDLSVLTYSDLYLMGIYDMSSLWYYLSDDIKERIVIESKLHGSIQKSKLYISSLDRHWRNGLFVLYFNPDNRKEKGQPCLIYQSNTKGFVADVKIVNKEIFDKMLHAVLKNLVEKNVSEHREEMLEIEEEYNIYSDGKELFIEKNELLLVDSGNITQGDLMLTVKDIIGLENKEIFNHETPYIELDFLTKDDFFIIGLNEKRKLWEFLSNEIKERIFIESKMNKRCSGVYRNELFVVYYNPDNKKEKGQPSLLLQYNKSGFLEDIRILDSLNFERMIFGIIADITNQKLMEKHKTGLNDDKEFTIKLSGGEMILENNQLLLI